MTHRKLFGNAHVTYSTVVLLALTALLAVFGTAFAAPQSALAEGGQLAGASLLTQSEDWSLSTSAVTLKRYGDEATVKITGSGVDSYWDYDAWSSDESVASVDAMTTDSDGNPCFTVEKKGVGSTTIIVESYEGTRQTLTVTCKPTDFKLYKYKYTFSKKAKYSSSYTISPSYEDGFKPDSNIKKAKSSKPKVASAKLVKCDGSLNYVLVIPKKPGKTKVKVTDQYKRTKTVTIVVKKNYFKAHLKAITRGYAYYGNKKVTVNTVPKAKVTFRIGSEKHTKKANKNGIATIKLKKIYKVGKKYSVTAKTKYGKAKYKSKVGSSSFCYFNGTIMSCKYYVPVRVSNVHKGDVLTIKAGTEKHSFKFHGNYSSYSTTFYMNYTLGNYYYLELILKNKFGQKLDTTEWDIDW